MLSIEIQTAGLIAMKFGMKEVLNYEGYQELLDKGCVKK